MHSRDKARKSLCIFSSSFFIASGLLVPDMIHQALSQFLSGANELWHCQILGETGSTPGASCSSAAHLLGSVGTPPGLGCLLRACPSDPRSLLATPPAPLRGAPRSRPAPLGPAGSNRGAPQCGQVPPALRGPATPVVSSQPSQSFSTGSPSPQDSRTPLAESPTIPSASGTRQPHFRAPWPPPPPRPTRAGEPRAGRGQGAWSRSEQVQSRRGAFPSPSTNSSGLNRPFASSKFVSFLVTSV